MSFSVSFMGGQLSLVIDIRKIAMKHIGIGNDLLKTSIVQVQPGKSVLPVHRDQEVRTWCPATGWNVRSIAASAVTAASRRCAVKRAWQPW